MTEKKKTASNTKKAPSTAAKKAPSVVPKKDNKKDDKKDGKKQDKKGLKTFLYIVGLLCLTGAVIVLSQLVVGYSMLLVLGKDTFSQPVPTTIYSALSYALAMVLLIFIYKKSSRRALGLHGLPTWTDIGLAPVGYLVYVLAAFLLTSLFSIFPWFNANEAQNVGFNIYVFGFDRLIAFIALVVIAPIAEELIFRGWLYGKLRAKLSSVTTNRISIVVSALLVSLLFGAVHMQWNVGVDVFALSLVLCTLREINGTIYSGILLHMLTNGIAFYLLFVLGIS